MEPESRRVTEDPAQTLGIMSGNIHLTPSNTHGALHQQRFSGSIVVLSRQHLTATGTEYQSISSSAS